MMETYIKAIKQQEKRLKYGNRKLWQKQSHPCLKKHNWWQKQIHPRLKKQNRRLYKKTAMYTQTKKFDKQGDET